MTSPERRSLSVNRSEADSLSTARLLWQGLRVIRQERVAANGIHFHVALAGKQGHPLALLLHGFPESSYSWRGQLEKLSENLLVAAPDLRGYGKSDKPPRVSDYRVGVLAADARALIHALGYEQAFVAGHDWGGAIAWHLASAHPECVERLAILNCPHPAVFSRALTSLDVEQIRRSLYMFFFQIPYLPERLFPPERLARTIRHTAVRKDSMTEEDTAAFVASLSASGTVGGGINYYRAIFRDLLRPSRRRELARIWARGVVSPTMVVWGEQDPFLHLRQLEGLEAYVHSTLDVRRIAGAGHWIQQEAVSEVNQALGGFFARGGGSDDPA